MINRGEKYYYPLLLVINAVLLYFFLFKLQILPLGWDTQFHLNRIEELYRSLKDGHLFSSTGTYTFSNIGLAINRFYPYLFLYLFAILRFVFNPIIAYTVASLLLTLASFLISYYAIKNLNYSRKSAFLFSILYNNGGYLLLQINQRGDIAEYIALILLPVIFMGGIKIFDSISHLWWWLPIGLILVAYDHILSTILFSAFLLLLFILEYKKINLMVIKRLLISGVVIILACLPLLLRMTWAQKQTSIIVPIVPDTLIHEAVSPSTLIINSFNNASPTNLLDVNLGIITLVAGITGLLVFKTIHKELIKFEILGLLFVFLSTNLFPWFIFQDTPIHVIQFPWRFMGIATFCFSFVLSQIIVKKSSKLIFPIWLIICAISFTYVYQYAYGPSVKLAAKDANTYNKVVTNAIYTDYMPQSVLEGKNATQLFRSKLSVHRHIAYINGQRVNLKNTQIIPKHNAIEYRLTNLKPGQKNKVQLPVLNYGKNYSKKGIRVTASTSGETEVTFIPEKTKQNIIIYLS